MRAPVVNVLGNLTHRQGKTPIRVKAFPGEMGAAPGTSAQDRGRNCPSSLCHSCQLTKEGLTSLPQTGSRGATTDSEGLDMSEAPSCPSDETPTPVCDLKTLYWACVHNDPAELQARLDAGVSPEEVSQTDSNGRVRCPRISRAAGDSSAPTPIPAASWSGSPESSRGCPHSLDGLDLSSQGLGQALGRCRFRGQGQGS